MSKLVVVTISDDRFGRKEGLYAQTQEKIKYILDNNPQIGVDDVISWTWEDIIKTDWYVANSAMLDNKDAARNGRAYKPFVILTTLYSLKEGDYVIYTDCSPEMWNMDAEIILPFSEYNTDVIKRLCRKNDDILTAFIKWDVKDIPSGHYGIHTHKHFTLNRCMDKMGMREYENHYMHASGMWCIRNTPLTREFVTEWLKWNIDEDCASLGHVNIPDDYSFWDAESHLEFGKEGYKMGHRHDQSISGLLLNKKGAKFIDVQYNDMNPYNFLQFTRTNVGYKFISGEPFSIETIEESEEEEPVPDAFLPGDVVENLAGIELTVFRKENDKYVVGKSLASCYATTEDKLIFIRHGSDTNQ